MYVNSLSKVTYPETGAPKQEVSKKVSTTEERGNNYQVKKYSNSAFKIYLISKKLKAL